MYICHTNGFLHPISIKSLFFHTTIVCKPLFIYSLSSLKLRANQSVVQFQINSWFSGIKIKVNYSITIVGYDVKPLTLYHFCYNLLFVNCNIINFCCLFLNSVCIKNLIRAWWSCSRCHHRANRRVEIEGPWAMWYGENDGTCGLSDWGLRSCSCALQIIVGNQLHDNKPSWQTSVW